MAGNTFFKDPDAVLDYGVDWTAWLGSDTILTSAWAVTPTGLAAERGSNTTKTTTIWLRGGTLGQAYDVVNRITTTGGRTDDRSLKVIIRAK